MKSVILKKDFSGRILDIGGGGEGVIGRVYGAQVTAIDISPEELAEAPGGFEKLVMDAGNMTFPDESFDHVTAFFSFLFIPKADHKQVISEIARVLRPGGETQGGDARLLGTLKGMLLPPASAPAPAVPAAPAKPRKETMM